MIALSLVALYATIGAWVFVKVRKLQRHVLQSKHGRRHPERFKVSVASDIIAAVFWPFQIMGVIALLFTDS